jgi:uncharacterized SAM-binding protein YcdF (DUF218 family)
VKRPLRKAGLALACVVLAALLFHDAILSGLGHYLVKDSPPHKADAAFVLAGDPAGSRILKAAQLVREGYVPLAVISGPQGNYGYYECDLAIPFAVRAGYPASYFVPFPNTAQSTREEAQQAAVRLHSMGIKHVLLVTSDYHTRRALPIFQKAAPDIDFSAVGAPDKSFTADGWWHSREGEKTFLMEWLKTMANWIKL